MAEVVLSASILKACSIAFVVDLLSAEAIPWRFRQLHVPPGAVHGLDGSTLTKKLQPEFMYECFMVI